MVSKALRATPGLEEILVHTGQHYDENMSQIFFEELKIPAPDYHLGIGSGSHATQTGRMLEAIERLLMEVKPKLALVYGDTNTTLAGALAAAKLHIPVGHVEAGLRSFNRLMPEEINRIVADHLSTWLFAPTETAVDNLRREGISKGVHFIGDVMYDAATEHLQIARSKSDILERLQLQAKGYALATVHRAENTDQAERLQEILVALAELSKECPVIFPVHPRTRKAMSDGSYAATPGLRITEPVSYLDMLRLESEARVILTDSGGVQKEAFFLRTPCVTLREETEWVETVKSGWNTITGTDPQRILKAVLEAKPGDTIRSPYGEGNAAKNLVAVLQAEGHHG